MPTQFSVKLEDKPGELGKFASALGDHGVNIVALSGDTFGKKGVINVLASDDDATRKALKDAKFAFSEREVLIAKVPDRPGALGQLAKNLGAARVNIESLVAISNSGGTAEIAIGVDNPKKAKDILK